MYYFISELMKVKIIAESINMSNTDDTPLSTCLECSVAIALYAVSIRGSTCPSVYFDLARTVSYDPTVLNLVAIRPYIVTQCLNMGGTTLAIVIRHYTMPCRQQ